MKPEGGAPGPLPPAWIRAATSRPPARAAEKMYATCQNPGWASGTVISFRIRMIDSHAPKMNGERRGGRQRASGELSQMTQIREVKAAAMVPAIHPANEPRRKMA